jgi:hypothetical protein
LQVVFHISDNIASNLVFVSSILVEIERVRNLTCTSIEIDLRLSDRQLKAHTYVSIRIAEQQKN